MDNILFIAKYIDTVVFYLTDSIEYYDWVENGDKIIPEYIIQGIMNNSPIEWGINDDKDIDDLRKYLKSDPSVIRRSVIVFKACKDFYSFNELHEYINSNDIIITTEVLVDVT